MAKEYPVSKEVCSKCGACSFVNKTITGAYMAEEYQYYQCIADMSYECSERAKEREKEAQKKALLEQAELAEHEREQEEMEEKEWQAFMREQNYTQNSMYGNEY